MSLVTTEDNPNFVITSNNPALDVINIYRKSKGLPELDIMDITNNMVIKWMTITNYELGSVNNWSQVTNNSKIAKQLYEEIIINPDLSAAINKQTTYKDTSLPFQLTNPEVEAITMPEETLFPELYQEQEPINLNEMEEKEKSPEIISQFNVEFEDDEERERFAMEPYQPREFLTASEIELLELAEEEELFIEAEKIEKKMLNEQYANEKKDLAERKKPMTKKYLKKLRKKENVEIVRKVKDLKQQKIKDATIILDGITEGDIRDALKGNNDKIMDAIEIVLKSDDWKIDNIIRKTNYICRKLLKFKEPISSENASNCITGLYWNLISDECLNSGYYSIQYRNMKPYKDIRRTLKLLWTQQYNWVDEEKGNTYSAATLRENKQTKGNWNNDILVIKNNVTKELKCYTVKTNKTTQRYKQLIYNLITPRMVLKASDLENIEELKNILDFNMQNPNKLDGHLFTTLKSFILNGGILIFHEKDPYRVLWEDLNKLIISILLKTPLVRNNTLRAEYPHKIRINNLAIMQICDVSGDAWQHFIPCIRWNQ